MQWLKRDSILSFDEIERARARLAVDWASTRCG